MDDGHRSRATEERTAAIEPAERMIDKEKGGGYEQVISFESTVRSVHARKDDC
jgi:hypothetical protein